MTGERMNGSANKGESSWPPPLSLYIYLYKWSWEEEKKEGRKERVVAAPSLRTPSHHLTGLVTRRLPRFNYS